MCHTLVVTLLLAAAPVLAADVQVQRDIAY